MKTVDLRSDTVTKPTAPMREAMARAEVGDDVYGEDPTVRALEERVAALLGKEAALFVPSGSMANQIALAIHTHPGDDVIIGAGAHCMLYESGAGGALAGIQFHELGETGLYTAAEVAAAIRPDNHHFAPTTLVAVENTHNRGGGRVFPKRDVDEIAQVARQHGCALHLDGARLLNAQVATGISARDWATPFDTASLCMSKGLGAPVGSLIAGTRAHVTRAHRRRKMMGGGMRQAGILAAAGLYALDHHVERLADDHKHARAFAEALGRTPGVTVLGPVESNIVIWDLAPEVPLDAAELVKRARERGVLLNAIGGRRVRAVTHLDVDARGVAHGAEVLRELVTSA
jgi:threonine aldolase